MIDYKRETKEMVLNGTSITIDVINSLVPSLHLAALYHENGLVCYSVKTRGLDCTYSVAMAFIKEEIIWPVLPYIYKYLPFSRLFARNSKQTHSSSLLYYNLSQTQGEFICQKTNKKQTYKDSVKYT